MNVSDPVLRGKLLTEAEKVSMDTQFKLIDIRDQAKGVEKNQGTWLKLVRKVLVVLGAVLIIIGKGFVVRHKSLATPKT